MDIECPPSMIPHVKRIFAGEYNLPYDPTRRITILDIGANVGGFALWARHRWPGAEVHCFEPLPDNLTMLTRNVASETDIHIHADAVGGDSQKGRRLYLGANNEGENSFFQLGEQREEFILVNVLVPASCRLPTLSSSTRKAASWKYLVLWLPLRRMWCYWNTIVRVTVGQSMIYLAIMRWLAGRSINGTAAS